MSPAIHPGECRSYNLIDFERRFDVDYGLSFRKSRSGPEENLIRSFLSKISVKSDGGIQLTVFKEPRLESGVPDLVGVFWHLPTAQQWNSSRKDLRRFDFRVLHQIACWGKAELGKI